MINDKPTIQIGKNGITDSLLNEITLQLKRKRMIKIKLLRSALDHGTKEELTKKLVENLPCKLVKRVGFVVTLSYVKSKTI